MRLSTRANIDRGAVPPKDIDDQGILYWLCDARRSPVSPTVVGTIGSKSRRVPSLDLLHRSVNIGSRMHVQLTYCHSRSCQPTPLRVALPSVPKKTTSRELSDHVQNGPLTANVCLLPLHSNVSWSSRKCRIVSSSTSGAHASASCCSNTASARDRRLDDALGELIW